MVMPFIHSFRTFVSHHQICPGKPNNHQRGTVCWLKGGLVSMNSYPIELLVQHAPLMFVAGLEDHATPHPGVSVNSDALPSPKQERRGSVNQDARDSFAVLTSRLRNSFASRRRGVIWDLNKSHHFNVVLVDKVCGSGVPPSLYCPS